MMNAIKFLILPILLPIGLFALETDAPAPLEPDANASHITRTLVQMMPRVHMNHDPFTEAISRRTLDNYLRSLDFDRSIFMAEDVMALRREASTLHQDLREGDLTLAFKAFRIFRERAANRVEFVMNMLEEGIDTDKEQEFVWRRKDAPWAESKEEWDELWRKKVTNEYVGYLVSQRMRELEAEEEAAKAEKEAKEAAENEANAVAEAAETEDAEADDPEDAETGLAGENSEDEPEEEPRTLVAPQLDLSPEDRIRRRYEQFISVLNGHDAEYVQQMFLSAFTRSYDTHSSYLSPRANEDFDINMRLSLTGIGAILTYDEGTAKIERLIEGGPAALDGRLQPGDKIIAVGQGDEEPEDILFWPLYRSVRLIRGEIGSTVVLHVIPASDPTGTEVRTIDLVREEIKLEENAAKSLVYELEREGTSFKVGIIQLPDFYRDFQGGGRSSAADVKALLEEMNEEGVDGLILDLRNNGGGSLQDAIEMTGYFIDSGPVVQVRGEGTVRALNDPNRGVVFDKPVVVMVNRQSASASEILAAALQDYGRAVIVGDSKTHGKGSVQSMMPLDRRDEGLGRLKVTTAAFYRVDGRSTQLKGVSPDIEIRSPSDVMEMGEEYLDNVLPWTWVRPARFMPFGDLREINESLRKRSEARLAENDEFQLYQRQVDRLAERVQRRNISLNFDERLAQAKSDRELDQLQERGLMLPIENGDEPEEPENGPRIRPERDLMLRETLQILADLVELSHES
ncbi:MAG: carboxy terminal-processing peptidase [Verrucomicrobia bacterium]|nr:carboxy terminal-processing peptidase [Verrucomicrobiota bacterium]MCH8512292.1 carboxy terminal-processing peptidase [Kiritimatiellia bacterium]